jgi:glyoxalase family protein
MAKQPITGLHHVTALAGQPQQNLDFYVGVLGLRLVKRTVNFDAPDTYHFYYGDRTGQPGSIMTFFPFRGIGPGRIGASQLSTTAFSIPVSAVDFWQQRLARFGVAVEIPFERWGETVLRFLDWDGLSLELIATAEDDRPGHAQGDIPQKHSIRGFYGVTLLVRRPEPTLQVLTNLLNYQVNAESEDRVRLTISGEPGQWVEVQHQAQAKPGVQGAGTVHHVAFRTPNDDTQLALLQAIQRMGLNPSPVMDRQYFHSVYFREPNGILFEVATDPPGFLLDEEEAQLGRTLKLAPWQEPQRGQIEKLLAKIDLEKAIHLKPSPS